MTTRRPQKTYDHRLRELVRRTRDLTIATRLGVPRSTAAGWLRGATHAIVSADPLSDHEERLQVELLRLRGRTKKLREIVRLLAAAMRALDFKLCRRRIPSPRTRAGLLRAIERSQSSLRLRDALRIVGLSESRYHDWRRMADTTTEPSRHDRSRAS